MLLRSFVVWFFPCGACILVENEEGCGTLSQGQREKQSWTAARTG